MIFIIGVYSAPAQPGALSAYQFARAVLSQQHQIIQIFFYQDGVLNALNTALFSQLNVPLLVCTSALLKREIAQDRLAQHFKAASLTQFFEGFLQADRYVIFGN